jgi:hypothetical protein
MEYAEKIKSKDEKSKNTAVIKLSEGRVPPQAVDMEEAVIGALLIDSNAINEVIEILEPQAFYKDSHAEIFDAIKQLFADSQPIDIFTVSDYLKKNGKFQVIGGDYALVNLSQRVSSAAHIEFHARVIVEKFIQRELIRVSGDIISSAFDEESDVLELLDKDHGFRPCTLSVSSCDAIVSTSDEIEALMNAETWLRAERAIDLGFAEATFEAPDYDEPEAGKKKALARLDATLAKAGLPRVERRALMREAAGTPSAAGTATPSAGFDADAFARLIATLKA